MTRFPTAACLILLAGVLHALAPSARAEIETVSPESLAVGDTGVCLTEVEGGVMREIPIRVIGVLGATRPEGELVLIRLEDARSAKEGVVAGMSGSPVYVGGRLVGALAYGWPFATEPIAGVTPFSRMETLETGSAEQISGAGPRPEFVTLLEALRDRTLPQTVLDWLAPEGGQGSLSVPAVFAAGGAAAGGLSRGWPAMIGHRLGWTDTPGGGSAPESAPASPLVPGSMVAAVLVTGDAQLAAGGTVTAIEGDRVWAFGHPFLGAGDVAMPLARASVVTILPSQASSFKFFNTGALFGTLHAGRPHGILATLGDGPAMVPVRVTIDDRTYSFRVIDHDLLMPVLSGMMVGAVEQARGRTLGLQTIDLGLRVGLARGGDLTLDQALSGADAVDQASAWTSAVLAYLTASPFAADDVKGVEVSLASTNGIHLASVVDISPDRWRVRPGETLTVRVRLQRPGEAIVTRRLDLEVPAEARPGRLDLVVADGASWTAYDLRARPWRSASFADEIRLLRRLRSSRQLVAAFEAPGESLVLPGGTVAAPPGSVATLKSGLGSSLLTAKYRVLAVDTVDTDGPVAAGARLRLEVEDETRHRGDDQ